MYKNLKESNLAQRLKSGSPHTYTVEVRMPDTSQTDKELMYDYILHELKKQITGMMDAPSLEVLPQEMKTLLRKSQIDGSAKVGVKFGPGFAEGWVKPEAFIPDNSTPAS